VLLYELLTGTTPLERQRLREAALGEVVRVRSHSCAQVGCFRRLDRRNRQ
jgi:hypothetical protein